MSTREPVYSESTFSCVIDNFRRYFKLRFQVECKLPGQRIFYHWRQSLGYEPYEPDEGLIEDDMAIRGMYEEQFDVPEAPGFEA